MDRFIVQTFSVPLSAFQKSSVIEGWIKDPTSIHPSLLNNASLHFPNVDPEVVKMLIQYLEMRIRMKENGLSSSLNLSKAERRREIRCFL